ncbi:MAG: glycoside hydrolase family 25 protein [Bacilli bacterium]|nr:glycoside hydrolase family 25 protein [Bacilli bacterium]
MKLIKNVIIVIFILLSSSCKKEEKIIFKREPEEVVLSFLEEVEIHDKIYLYDLILEKNVDIISENEEINTHKLGNKELEIEYQFKTHKYKRTFNLNIKDTTKPFIYSSSVKTIYLNNKHNLCEELIFGDNHDPNPKCEIIGSYDNTKIEKYNIKMKVTDQSNNQTEKLLTINIKEKIKPSTQAVPPKSLEFSEVIQIYKDKNISYGIDISSWQEEVDFKKVKEAGASFVMIRIGFQRSSTRELSIDKYYEQNIKEAKKAGLKVGVYLYTEASSINEAKNHATWVLNKLNKLSLDLPIVFDWEDFSNFRKHKISLYQLNEMANIFIKTVVNSGYEGMIYSSKTYLENFWNNINNYPVWLAHYTEKTDYKGDYIMWQLSNIGKIPGINAPVDINIMYAK